MHQRAITTKSVRSYPKCIRRISPYTLHYIPDLVIFRQVSPSLTTIWHICACVFECRTRSVKLGDAQYYFEYYFHSERGFKILHSWKFINAIQKLLPGVAHQTSDFIKHFFYVPRLEILQNIFVDYIQTVQLFAEESFWLMLQRT